MENFYRDNPDIEFHLKHIDLRRVVEFKEDNFAEKDRFAEAPRDLDDALDKLHKKYPRQSQVAEYRLFAGMTITDIAHVLAVSRRTVTEDWALARAWLARELRPGTNYE